MVDDNREIVNEVEEALRTLAPRATAVNRDRLMWLAGRASLECELQSGRRRVVWPIVNCLGGVAAGLLVAFLIRPAPVPSPAIVSQPETPTASQTAPDAVWDTGAPEQTNIVADVPKRPLRQVARLHSIPPSMLSENSSYLQLRSAVLAYGADALPDRIPAGSSRSREESNVDPPTQQNLLREMLNHKS